MFTNRRAIAVVLLSSFVWTIAAPVLAESVIVEVPAGTRVLCAFTDELAPATSAVGQRITLRVVDAIKVNEQVVIEAGALAVGEVTQSRKRGAIGKPDIIGVTLYSVTAVDGSALPVTGQRVAEGDDKQTSALVITILCCVLGLLQKGGKASIPQGAQIEGTVTGLAKVAIPVSSEK
jgi:hypothetical protein